MVATSVFFTQNGTPKNKLFQYVIILSWRKTLDHAFRRRESWGIRGSKNPGGEQGIWQCTSIYISHKNTIVKIQSKESLYLKMMHIIPD